MALYSITWTREEKAAHWNAVAAYWKAEFEKDQAYQAAEEAAAYEAYYSDGYPMEPAEPIFVGPVMYDDQAEMYHLHN